MKTSALAGHHIATLRKTLGISQTELGKRLGATAITVSRWERNESQPPAGILLKLGTMAHKNSRSCWDFWELAGLTPQIIAQALPKSSTDSLRKTFTVSQVVGAGPGDKLTEDSLVAITLADLVASAGTDLGSSHGDLASATSRHAVVAPKLWCPNPADTICLRVSGNSMRPLLQNGYMIVLDQKQNDRKKLSGMMIVAKHKKFGLVVSRFWLLKNSAALIPDNREYDPVPWSAGWQVAGKVLWWIGQPQ